MYRNTLTLVRVAVCHSYPFIIRIFNYYLTLLVVDQLTGNIIIHIFAYKVQDGSLSAELIRPAHPMLTNTFMNNLASKALNLLVFVPVWGLLCLIHRPTAPSPASTSWLPPWR